MSKRAKKQWPRRTKEEISRIMRKVKSSGSKMENVLGKSMWSLGLIYRKQYRKIPGRPDFVFPSAKVAVFCDSNFWHGYRWQKNRSEFKRRKGYWLKKIERNMARDKKINKELKREGWKVIRFWEHQIKKGLDRCAQKVFLTVERRKKA